MFQEIFASALEVGNYLVKKVEEKLTAKIQVPPPKHTKILLFKFGLKEFWREPE